MSASMSDRQLLALLQQDVGCDDLAPNTLATQSTTDSFGQLSSNSGSPIHSAMNVDFCSAGEPNLTGCSTQNYMKRLQLAQQNSQVSTSCNTSASTVFSRSDSNQDMSISNLTDLLGADAVNDILSSVMQGNDGVSDGSLSPRELEADAGNPSALLSLLAQQPDVLAPEPSPFSRIENEYDLSFLDAAIDEVVGQEANNMNYAQRAAAAGIQTTVTPGGNFKYTNAQGQQVFEVETGVYKAWNEMTWRERNRVPRTETHWCEESQSYVEKHKNPNNRRGKASRRNKAKRYMAECRKALALQKQAAKMMGLDSPRKF